MAIGRVLVRDGGPFPYVEQADRVLRDRLGARYVNFFNPESSGGQDCEFLRGVHAGEVAAARMLQIVAERETAKKYMDRGEVRRTTAQMAGLTTDPADIEGEFPGNREDSFLGLGCFKVTDAARASVGRHATRQPSEVRGRR